ncbi:hypothetical protein [Mesorhizobium sp. GR13]|uniref:hypothetical protein n=1 Tax=Mesorhizobium sp. GR13 TaxID=2562308 RepID=UPI0010BF6FB8|nr:hypothetical protein [Mesorhizobium sp. GR13]
MHSIEMQTPSETFARCCHAAGCHIQSMGDGAIQWLKAELIPPFLEHLSFRMGNQLFFIRVEAHECLDFPGNRSGLSMIANECGGLACILPMVWRNGEWRPQGSGWGLHSLMTGRPIIPPALVTDQLIEMTDWELQDFAVQIVREELRAEGRDLMSWQGSPHVDPSIWFVGDNGPEWVVVRGVRFPQRNASVPANWDVIADRCAAQGLAGHFASVAVVSASSTFEDDKSAAVVPLWRGHGMECAYEGLQRIDQI